MSSRAFVSEGVPFRGAIRRRYWFTPRLEELECRLAPAVVTPFTTRFSVNATGEIMLIGNTLETASVTGNPGRTQQDVVNAQNGVGANVDNNEWNMAYVDVDNNPSTFDSSQSTLTLPSGASVLFAGLYWGSVTTTTAQASARTSVLFSTPATTGYTSLTGTLVGAVDTTGNPTGSIYQGFANVTSLVQAGGSGAYGIANVQGTLQSGSYAGWSLVVVVQAPGDPARNLTVLDGFAVQGSSDPALNVPVSGFITPPTGPVNSKVGVVAYEGDLGITGDSMALNGVKLSSGVSPANNFFNSTISNQDQLLTAKNPNYIDQLGFDIKNVQIQPGTIPNGATSATITLSTSGDGYFPGVLTFQTDLFSPNISVAKSYTDLNGASPGPGDLIKYTVTLTNTGQDAANNLIFTDPIPANTTYVPGSLQIVSGPGAGSKTDAPGDDQAEFVGNQVIYQLGTGANAIAGGSLAIGASTTISFEVMIDNTTPHLTVVTNQGTATYTGATTGFNLSSLSNTANFTVLAQADLQIIKSVSNPTPNVGEPITYTISVSNLGPDAATGVVVQDVLPPSINFAGATESQGTYDDATGQWSVGSLDVGASAMLFVQAIVIDSPPGTNTAAIIASDVPDPNTSNNSAIATVSPLVADLHLTKTIDDATPNVGQNITYTLTLTNTGPDTATGTIVSDPLPPGLTFQSANPGQGTYDNTSGIWSVGSLANGATVTLTLTARVDDDNPRVNSAVASSNQFDPSPADNSASVTDTPQVADLQISKTVTNSNPSVGTDVTFTITLSDLGPDNATGVTVLDLLPTGLMFESATPSGGTTYDSTSGIWTIGNIATDADETLVIVALVVSPNPATNTAVVNSADQFDPNTNNNTSSAVVAPLEADLALTKTVSTATPNVGETITYTLMLTNNGPDPTTGVQVNDPLPAGVTYLSSMASQGDYDGTTGLWTIGSMAANANVSLTITARVDTAFIATNSAVASSNDFDPDPANNSASAVVSPPQADLIVTKSVSNATPNVGDTITFTIEVRNAGPDDATGAAVQDLLPSGLGFLSATPSQGTYNSGTGTWAIGGLPNGSTATLLIDAIVYAPFQPFPTYAVTNFATVSADQFDPDESNNLSSVMEAPRQVADLALTKVANRSQVVMGLPVTYTVSVANLGPAAATGVVVADQLPAGLALIGPFTLSQGTFDPATGTWNVGSLPDAASATLILVGQVDTLGPLVNTATVSADEFDPDLSNNTGSATVTGMRPADMVSKLFFLDSFDPSSADPAETVAAVVRQFAATGNNAGFLKEEANALQADSFSAATKLAAQNSIFASSSAGSAPPQSGTSDAPSARSPAGNGATFGLLGPAFGNTVGSPLDNTGLIAQGQLLAGAGTASAEQTPDFFTVPDNTPQPPADI